MRGTCGRCRSGPWLHLSAARGLGRSHGRRGAGMSLPVVIVGAGPAGLACADRLAGAGQRCVLIDDNVQAGGQYFRQLPASYTTVGARLLRDKSRFDALSKVLSRPEVT